MTRAPYFFGQGADFREPCNVAAHGEHAVGNDKGTVLLRHTGKLLFQILHIAVAVAQHLSVAHLAAGIDGGVVLPVADHIVVPAHQGTDDAHIGLKACTKGDDRLLMQEPGQLLLQLQVQLEGAVEKTGAAAPGAELLQCLYPGLHDLWVCGEAQVVVGAQHNTALAFHHNLYILPGLEGVKIGINAFFLQLIS